MTETEWVRKYGVRDWLRIATGAVLGVSLAGMFGGSVYAFVFFGLVGAWIGDGAGEASYEDDDDDGDDGDELDLPPNVDRCESGEVAPKGVVLQ